MKHRKLILFTAIIICAFIGYKIYMRAPSESAMVNYAKEAIEKELASPHPVTYSDIIYIERERTDVKVDSIVCGMALTQNARQRFIVYLTYSDTGNHRQLRRSSQFIPEGKDAISVAMRKSTWDKVCKK
ncbi:hypothetical protein CHU32_10175 [Superficieibacter electus]|uniref:Uncharacterized protein n=2 Tax=Superficieibacter electus TaxID=2022662 RepID=A0A2P5GQX5_9ENTR|nr:hypothetical protein CHU33_16290 [Superficieibacter electus]POP48950.1 hypothetical protein CHU32_10175 [Superficieibacter electus]